jgi:hypothetical protein
MGRVWDFFKQDANSAMDRMVGPWARFVVNHRALTWAIYLVVLVLIGVFISRTLALVFGAVMLGLMLLEVVSIVLKRRSRR